MTLKIGIVTPVSGESRAGNGVTARRWRRILGELGHEAAVLRRYAGGDYDMLICLHAFKSAHSIEKFRRVHPDRPLVLALTGTDVYRDLKNQAKARRAVEIADRLVVLQPLGLQELPRQVRERTTTIFQSVRLPDGVGQDASLQDRQAFPVCVLSHLREVKDPLRAAQAARRLPPESKVRVLHAGRAMERRMEAQAREEMARNPRYEWLGEIPRREALARLAGSRALIISSRLEGGANVLSEAIALGVPVLSTRIAGSVGILGADYPGYYPVGDSKALASLLRRAESDPGFHAGLKRRIEKLKPLVDPERERSSWAQLLRSLSPRYA